MLEHVAMVADVIVKDYTRTHTCANTHTYTYTEILRHTTQVCRQIW
jgi:hypothetical protein